jgi:hypothetical protein
MSGEGLHSAAAIQTAKSIVTELRFRRYDNVRRLLGELIEHLDATEAAQRHGEESGQ